MGTGETIALPRPGEAGGQPGGGMETSPDRAGVSGPRSEAAERVKTYLRAAGLSDEACLDRATEAMLGLAVAEQPEGDAEGLPQRAVTIAMRSVEQWLDGLVASSADGSSSAGARGLAAWRLRGLLGQHPEAFLDRGDVPDAVRRAIEGAVTPILPEGRPAYMVPQPLGSLPPVLRSDFWHDMGRRARWFWRTTVTTLIGE